MGTILVQVSSGFLLKYTQNNWTLVFYLCGSIALVWSILWMLLVYNSPNEHPTITEHELDYLNQNLKGVNKVYRMQPSRFTIIIFRRASREARCTDCVRESRETRPYNNVCVFFFFFFCPQDKLTATPWCAMLLSGPIVGLVVGQIGHDWALFMINSDLPKYMKSVMKFSIAEVCV